MNNQRKPLSGILALVFGLLFIASSVFGFWAYSGMQDNQNNLDSKVADAVAVAVQQAETAKDTKFTEQQKLPYKTYTSSSTYGSLSFNYPKNWSVYVQESGSNNVLDLYAHPNVIPDLASEQPYALRVQITNTTYDQEVQDMSRSDSTLVSSAFRPEKVPAVLGLKFTGELDKGKQGSMVLLPLRDRSIKVFTESQNFLNDFNSVIIPSINFIP